jgi:hypothetical protein
VAFNAVAQWFWIDDRDPQSKKLLSFLTLLFSLTKSRNSSAMTQSSKADRQ